MLVLSKRERHIAIACGAVLTLGIVLLVILGPYFSESADISAQLKNAQDEYQNNLAILANQTRYKDAWAKTLQHGMQADETNAQILVLSALTQWAPAAGVNLDNVKPEKGIPQGPFEVIGFSLSGTGTTRSVSLLTWDLEHAGIPLRVNEVFIQPPRQGSDDLQFRLSISTLCEAPPAPAKAGAAGTGVRS